MERLQHRLAVVRISGDGRLISKLGAEVDISVIARVDMIVGETHIGDRATAGLSLRNFVQIRSVAAASEKIVVNLYVVDRSPIVVEHHRGSLVMFVDDRVVGDGETGKTTVSLNPIIVRVRRALHIMDEVVLDDSVVASNVDAVGTILNVIVQECALARDALATSALIVDAAILNNGAGDARLNQDDVVSAVRYLAVFQRDIRSSDSDRAVDIESFNHCARRRDSETSRLG